MTNELLDAANNSGSKDSSEERYKKLKEKQAGNDMSESEQRYKELKKDATEEFIEQQRRREQEDEESSEEPEDVEEEDEGGFITH
ncbi:hypothetical protein [Candidatus Nanohalococcus occultus]|uniref:Uncharacterized protein n=1 Tax=Candidatus Nanohalococcus occultus TaxID=2978047 RepID=A0ABY8CIM1_9ARCH|nr:hypothetical protein SVXNc_0853 [Candidatus Nanohaloarchaeota archaeon SVXNc]